MELYRLVVTASYLQIGDPSSIVGECYVQIDRDGQVTMLSFTREPNGRCLSFPHQEVCLVPSDLPPANYPPGIIPLGVVEVAASQLWPGGIPLELRARGFGRI